MRRAYTSTERAKAVALAQAIGMSAAARELDIPRKTIGYWMAKPAASEVIAAVEADNAQMMRDVYSLALTKTLAALHNPNTPARDIATILKISGEQLNLAEGRATANIATNVTHGNPFDDLTAEEARNLARLLDDEIDQRRLALEAQGDSADVG
jgi:hypothetical protein